VAPQTTLLVVCIAFTAVTAHADVKAVEAVVKTNITGLASLKNDDELGLAPKAIVINHMGTTVDIESEDVGCVSGHVANSFYGCNQASFRHKPGAITIGVDDAKGIAWFQAPYTVIAESENPDNGKTSKWTQAMRTGGILVRTGKDWEIVAQMYSQLVTDKELLAGTGGKPASGAPRLSGNAKLAGAVAGWFSTGFAGAAAKSGTIVASGTSTAEMGVGAKATKLAAGFDKLPLGATDVEATVLADGAIGWATAKVMMPRKNGKGAVQMRLAVVAVPEGDGWRWVSLQYQFPWDPVGR
jgi:hypothetical protein